MPRPELVAKVAAAIANAMHLQSENEFWELNPLAEEAIRAVVKFILEGK